MLPSWMQRTSVGCGVKTIYTSRLKYLRMVAVKSFPPSSLSENEEDTLKFIIPTEVGIQ